MRIIGFILILLGAVALGYESFFHVAGEKGRTLWVPPVVGGIALVCGLLLLAAVGRRGES
jgi:hypothetical protein